MQPSKKQRKASRFYNEIKRPMFKAWDNPNRPQMASPKVMIGLMNEVKRKEIRQKV